MNKKKFLSLFLTLAMVFSMAIPAFAEETVTSYVIPDVKGQLVILHTNDTHGGDVAVAGKSIGTAGVAQLKKDFEAAGAEVLLLNAGDAIQGEPLVSLSQGATAIDFMNLAGYDAMTVGNHEMDYGYENLKNLAKTANFPILGADVLDAKTSTPVFEANKVFTTASGLKVGVFGLATPETLTKADATKMPGITFPQGDALVKLAQAQVDELKKAGVDLVVCLGHLGVDAESAGNRSFDLCNKVTGIDLFVDGHSHTVMENGKPTDEKIEFDNKSDTLIVSTGTKLANVGVVIYDKTAKTLTPSLISAAAYSSVDKTVAEAIAAKNTEIDKELSVVFGKSEVTLNGEKAPGNRTMETNLGNFATDALLWQTRKTLGEDKVDAALTNGGGIRAEIPAGDVSMKTMKTVFPFGNTVATITLTGAQLLEALEAATCTTPEAIGAFPQVSGIVFSINTAVPYENGAQYPSSTYYAPAKPGARVTIDTVNGKAFDLKATYTIATNDFTAKGNDTYGVFKAVGGWKDIGIPMEDALISYTKEVLKGTISTEQYGAAEGRITVLSATETPAEKPVETPTEKPAETPATLPADVAADAWYASAVGLVLDSEIMTGTDKGFEPNGILTRAQVCQILYNLEEKPAVEKAVFADVAGKWYADAANWAAATGLVAGDAFAGDTIITRAETAQIIANYAITYGLTVDTTGMAMKEAPDYATIPAESLGGMTFCYYGGIIKGDDAGNLTPMGQLTRAQMAQIMVNFSTLIVENLPAAA